MTGPADHSACRDYLRDSMLAIIRRDTGDLAGSVTVTTFRVVAPNGYREVCMRCPHGVRYWVAPDAELQRYLDDPRTELHEHRHP